jgi:hypothetical protein
VLADSVIARPGTDKQSTRARCEYAHGILARLLCRFVRPFDATCKSCVAALTECVVVAGRMRPQAECREEGMLHQGASHRRSRRAFVRRCVPLHSETWEPDIAFCGLNDSGRHVISVICGWHCFCLCVPLHSEVLECGMASYGKTYSSRHDIC